MLLDTFISQIVESQLLTADGVRHFIDALLEDKRPKDGLQLALELVKQKKLTAYQAKTIYAGKGKALASASMGMVLKAEHTRMERLVALIVLSSKVIKEPGALQRFQREVKAAARLSHPNIVTAHDVEEVKGTHFLVMEYVDGIDLASRLSQQGRLSVESALSANSSALPVGLKSGNAAVNKDPARAVELRSTRECVCEIELVRREC